MGLRAAGHGLPFLPWRGGVGTSFPQLNPTLRRVRRPDPRRAAAGGPGDRRSTSRCSTPRRADALRQRAGRRHRPHGRAARRGRRARRSCRPTASSPTRRSARTRSAPGSGATRRVVHAPFGTHPYSNGGDDRRRGAPARVRRAAARGATALDACLDRHVRDAARATRTTSRRSASAGSPRCWYDDDATRIPGRAVRGPARARPARRTTARSWSARTCRWPARPR